jgi:hypothetical protein
MFFRSFFRLMLKRRKIMGYREVILIDESERVSKEARRLLEEYRKTLSPDVYFFIGKPDGLVLEREQYPSLEPDLRLKYGVTFAFYEYGYPEPDSKATLRFLSDGWFEQISPSSMTCFKFTPVLEETSIGFQKKIIAFIRHNLKNLRTKAGGF